MDKETKTTEVQEKTGSQPASLKNTANNSSKFDKGAAKTVAKTVYGDRKAKQRRERRDRNDKKDEFEQRILDIARVTRVMAGGKRMNFRACVGIGDKNGKVSVGLGKGADVSIAVNKAVNRAKKEMVSVSMVNETIAHEIYHREGAAKLLFKPARKGRGVIAGGVVRSILELAGIKNISAKILGTNNKVNNARCAVNALKKLKKVESSSDNNKVKNKNVDNANKEQGKEEVKENKANKLENKENK
ncbi:MAG: 30S ribosomal protein S5 [Candidatus Pacebacteria bacterium]|nr:30S ribosomal protein S5 [Candidatus Paceibacterota bacterium]